MNNRFAILFRLFKPLLRSLHVVSFRIKTSHDSLQSRILQGPLRFDFCNHFNKLQLVILFGKSLENQHFRPSRYLAIVMLLVIFYEQVSCSNGLAGKCQSFNQVLCIPNMPCPSLNQLIVDAYRKCLMGVGTVIWHV